jgi:hypothetical protein
MVSVEGDTGAGRIVAQRVVGCIEVAVAEEKMAGPLLPPGREQNPNYLRERKGDGTSEAIFTFGTCRAWTVRHADKNGLWGEAELIDREKELLAPMRRGGFDLLNQWMAPWEYLLVHHDPAEHWENANGHFEAIPVAESEGWRSDQYFDQGRAAAFDDLVDMFEGDAGDPIVRMLLTPLPHLLFRMSEHPWHGGSSFWSPWENPEVPKSSMNGFCATEGMTAWDFFKADPRAPKDDVHSILFDKQANFFRYLIARWGYSSAVGAWVLLDEIEGIGDEEAYYPDRSGYWKHPECDRWLGDAIRLFKGRLQRASDGVAYDGDPYGHPVSAACSSINGTFAPGDNVDWRWGDADAKPDLLE